MLRSRANTIEGGTTEVNKNILAERVLGPAARARPVARQAAGETSPAADGDVPMTLPDAAVSALGPGGLARVQPARGRQRDGRDDAGRARGRPGSNSMPTRDVRVIVNTGAGQAFQTGLDVVQLAREPEALREQSRRTKRAELRLTAWHNGVGKPVIAAVNGVCAGGGLHFVADADIVIAASRRELPRPARLGRAGRARTRRSGWPARSPFEAVMRMALAGRHERLSAQRAYELGHDLAGGRSARTSCASRRRRWPRRSPATSPPRWRDASGRCGTRWRWVYRRVPGGSRRAGVDVGSPRSDRGPPGLRREA